MSDKNHYAALFLAWLALGCTPERYSQRARHAADGILERRHEEVLGTREASALQPAQRVPEPAATPDEGGQTEPPLAGPPEAWPARVIDLREALAIAYQSNRDLISRREDLHLTALSLSGVRHGFTPQLGLTLSYLFDETRDVLDRNSGAANFLASQILPTGATLSLDASSGAAATEGSSGTYSSLVTLSLAQPLLRGGGYGVTHEPLIQAERNLVYAIRDFELFREDFSIDVARRYYGLVNQKQAIENQRRNLESNEFGRRRAEALFAVGRAAELDVLRERRSELSARNDYLAIQEDFELARDNFRIFLGLAPDSPIDVSPDSPVFTPMNYELASAIVVAEANRLDLLNRREQMEDDERGVRLARNALLPDLTLGVGMTHATDPSGDLGGSTLERDNLSAQVTLGLPLDRVRERNAYRTAQISLGRTRRGLEEFEDRIRVEITSSFRALTRTLESLEINRQLIEDQTKNLRIAEIRFERGELPNRDVVEARQSLLDAQNRLIDEQVGYEIARLELLRSLGILFVDETGMWKQ